MQQEYDLPDEERRDELDNLLSNLERARDSIWGDEAVREAGIDPECGISGARNNIEAAIEEVRAELDGIPEWDAQTVRDLVLEHAGRNDTTTESVNTEVVLRFEVGDYGNETKCRYAVAVTSDNEWFHVRRDGEWQEVWRN